MDLSACQLKSVSVMSRRGFLNQLRWLTMTNLKLGGKQGLKAGRDTEVRKCV